MSSENERSKASRSEYLKAYRIMLMARVLEEKLASLYRAGLIKGGVFLGRGQEALSVSVGINLRKGDIFAPLIRDQAGRMAFGDSVLDTLRTYLGSQLGSMRGRDGNIHRGRPREGYYAMISHLGAMIPVIAGGFDRAPISWGDGCCRRNMPGRRRDLDRGVPRRYQCGRGREASLGDRCGK